MSESTPPGRQHLTAAVLGWLVFIACAALILNSVELPRTPLDQRAELRALHSTLGLIVVVLVAARLIVWFRAPAPRPPVALPASSFGFNRAVLLAILFTFAITGLIGFPYAWADGQTVILFGRPVPSLFDASPALRGLFGYAHSALAFYYLMLFATWIVFGIWQHLRYRAGLLRLLPGTRV
jgi:cytochrome b561